jgi:hypothetical protein
MHQWTNRIIPSRTRSLSSQPCNDVKLLLQVLDCSHDIDKNLFSRVKKREKANKSQTSNLSTRSFIFKI